MGLLLVAAPSGSFSQPLPTPEQKRELGVMLAPGIAEELTAEQVKMLNQSRVPQVKKPFASEIAGIRFFDSGRIISFDSSGRVIEKLASSDVAPGFHFGCLQSRNRCR